MTTTIDSTTMEEPNNNIQFKFRRKMQERKVFMEELREMRIQNYKSNFKEIKRQVGPKWYQVISKFQERLLDSLDFCIYQDLLEGRPHRTQAVLNGLGIHPIPGKLDLLSCMFLGRDDSKEFLAQLFYFKFEHEFSQSREFAYPLSARLILSSIYYLGLANLIELLEEKFKPDRARSPSPPPLRKKKKAHPVSPYLEHFTLTVYQPPEPKRRAPPPPLPNLDDLNKPYNLEPPVQRNPPPPPPPPPPKKRIPVPICDKMVGYITFSQAPQIAQKPRSNRKTITPRLRASEMCLLDNNKKGYGLDSLANRKKQRQKMARPPLMPYDLKNQQFVISGVVLYGKRSFFILSGISIVHMDGYSIHGGDVLLRNQYVRLNLGVRGRPPPPPPNVCNCVSKWTKQAFSYVNKSKCRCGHFYDFKNTSIPPMEQPTYFQKPSPAGKGYFDYNSIFEMGNQLVQLQKDVKKIWDQDSVLEDSEGGDRCKKVKRDVVVEDPTDCLGENPKIEDYLRCALRRLRHINLAAKLPEIHQAPELTEWMRNRIYGPYTPRQKRDFLKKSRDYWTYMNALQKMGLGKVWPEKTNLYQTFRTPSTWKHKMSLQKSFQNYIEDYKSKVLKAHALFNNNLWATMYDARFHDKRFKEIFFCYTESHIAHVQLLHPYCPVESNTRHIKLFANRTLCLPKGARDVSKN